MGRFLVAAFVATFIAAIAAVIGVPVLAQDAPTPPSAAADEISPRARLLAMDTDHDGRISKAEWLAGGRSERGFNMMDANHDGYLTMDEVKAGRAKMRAMRAAQAPQ